MKCEATLTIRSSLFNPMVRISSQHIRPRPENPRAGIRQDFPGLPRFTFQPAEQGWSARCCPVSLVVWSQRKTRDASLASVKDERWTVIDMNYGAIEQKFLIRLILVVIFGLIYGVIRLAGWVVGW